MRNIVILTVASATFVASMSLFIAVNADARNRCDDSYRRCQTTCRDNSAGGKNFGTTLWDNDRAQSCKRSCSTNLKVCKIASVGGDSMELKKPSKFKSGTSGAVEKK
jgi:hypothetical protein